MTMDSGIRIIFTSERPLARAFGRWKHFGLVEALRDISGTMWMWMGRIPQE